MTEIIRKTRLADINDIYKIELAQSSSPWKKEHFVDEISNDLSYFFVIENYISNEIIGFIIFWIIDDIDCIKKEGRQSSNKIRASFVESNCCSVATICICSRRLAENFCAVS